MKTFQSDAFSSREINYVQSDDLEIKVMKNVNNEAEAVVPSPRKALGIGEIEVVQSDAEHEMFVTVPTD